MKLPRLLLLFFLAATTTLIAQKNVERPDHARRARPEIDREMEKKMERYPYIQSATISNEFGLFVNVNTISEGTSTAPQNESSIAINPVAPNVLIASAVDARGCIVYVSTDGGRSWTNKNLGVVNLDWLTGNDPSVAFDYEGNGYMMYGAFAIGTGQSGVYVAKSTDNGANWTPHLKVIEHKGEMTPDSAFEDKYYIEIDNSPTSPYRGNMYTPWKRVIDRDSSTQIVVSRSTDRGLTWSVPITVSPRKPGTSLDTTFGQSFPITTTGPDGTLYVFWHDGPIRSIGFVKSTDGGSTFTAPTYPVQGYETHGTAKRDGRNVYHVLKGTFRAECYPTVMADVSNSPRRGWLYLAWAAGLNPDIFFIRSTDGGATWSSPKVIHSETKNDQWWPWLSIDETNGDIAVMYSDSRNDPENILIDTYVSYSSDGGDTWIDRRATDFMSDFRKNPYVNGIFAGDYSGNAFHNGKIYPSHLDTREDNDVFTSLINLRTPPPVENLAARGNVNNLREVSVTWTYPSAPQTIFGLPVSSYSFVVSRGSTVLATLPPGTLRYDETNLDLDSTYVYTVRVAAGADTSAPRTVTYKPSDARLPGRPDIVTVHDNSPQIELVTTIPGVRADSATRLHNLKGVRVYRDGLFIREEPLTPGDTGRTITITDTPGERGYYRYTLTVVDASDPSLEGAAADTVTVYAGPVTAYTESFDAAKPRFIYTGRWAPTSTLALSAPNSVTDSPDGIYLPRRNTSMQIFPVAMPGPIDLTFAQIVIVDPADTATVEVSYDSGRTWSVARRFSWNDDPAWSDQAAASGDWRQARITLTHPFAGPNAIGIVRFRLGTTTANNFDGWYVDDISFGQPAGVKESPAIGSLASRAYPNPATSSAIIEYHLPERAQVSIRVLDLMGREVVTLLDARQEPGSHAVTFDGANLPNGVYLYEIIAAAASARGRIMLAK